MLRSFFVVLVACLLVGCDSIKNSLGMDHYQPDEFNIRENDNLTIPPNYNLAPPHKRNEDGKLVPISAQKAKQAVVGGGVDANSNISKENASTISKLGPSDASIRETVDKEAEGEDDSGLSKKLSSWKKEFLKNASSISNKDSKAEA